MHGRKNWENAKTLNIVVAYRIQDTLFSLFYFRLLVFRHNRFIRLTCWEKLATELMNTCTKQVFQGTYGEKFVIDQAKTQTV